MLKVLSYNVYGKKDVESPVPDWETRQENLHKIINQILQDQDVKVLCFQEMNENNMTSILKICEKHNFIILGKFPMKSIMV